MANRVDKFSNRRALIVAPLYDGTWLPPLPGRPILLESLKNCLEIRGAYDVKSLDNIVSQEVFRKTMEALFDSPGEILLYFYGHGCLGTADLGYFATSDAAPYKEGVMMLEVNAHARKSAANEIILIYDCCHAGAAAAISSVTLDNLASELSSSAGRVMLAACANDQEGWETTNNYHKKLGAFSTHILEGLEGAAVPRGGTKVRGTSLGEYVTRQFREWNQDPIVHCKETGTRHCIITSGFAEDVDTFKHTKRESDARILGAPFKPSQLFVGRSAELEGLVDTLVAGNRPIAVSTTVEGLGGIGKTELVLQLLHHPSILAAFDAIVWLDGGGPLAPQWEKLAADADIALPAKRPKNFLPTLERSLKKLGDVLVVLDNATDWKSVADWIPVELPLLVTTRTRDFGGHRFIHTELDVLSEEAAFTFITQMIPENSEDSALPKLLEEMGGHALALELAGWNMKYLGLSPNEYIERFKKHADDSDFALLATRYGNTVEGCLALTWNSLSHDASRTLWRRASLFAPTSAHRDLLRVSAIGSNESRDEMERMVRYMQRRDMQRRDEFDDPEFRGIRAASNAILQDSSAFDAAYAELRAFHVLARVEGFNGERWAMHRIVRDFGQSRLRKVEIMLHGMAIAEWLRQPTLPLRPEIPHLVATILASARHQDLFEARHFGREQLHRSPMFFDSFDAGYFLEFIRDELNDPKALTLILEGVSDVNEDVRIQSIRLLEHLGPIPEVREALQTSLADPDPEVRRRAAVTLAKHGGKKTIEILSQAMRGPIPRARLTAVKALGLMGKKAHTTLKEALNHDDEHVQVEAALLLSEQGQKNSVPLLLEKLNSLSGRQKDRAVEALGEARDPRSIDSLVELLPDERQRIRCINALGKIGGDRGCQLIVTFLNDENDQVRCAAARSIEAIGSEEGIDRIVEALAHAKIQRFDQFPSTVQKIAMNRKITLPFAAQEKLLKDRNWEVRMECAIELGQAKSQEAVEALIEALGDNDYDVRREVAKALGLIGDSRATERLKEVGQKDSVVKVKKAVKVALKQIGGS